MFTTNTNLPLGTYVADGLRSGPYYPDRISGIPGQTDDNGRLLSVTGQIYSTTHNTYGPGMLYSPIQTYDITPLQPNPVGFSVTTNVVAATPAASITGAGNLALVADEYVTTAITNPDGTAGLQFDWPRVVSVTISGAIATVGTRVTIFGYDYYYMPMQYTYIVSAIGTYPTISGGLITAPAAVQAFFGVTSVYINQALGAGATISLGASNIFGLPYRMNDFGMALGVSWGGQSELTVPALGSPLTNVAASAFSPALGLTTASTATTRDVRGVYAPSSAADGSKSLVFTYYVRGANTAINQQAAMNWPQYNTVTAAPGTVQPLALANFYGVPQFYTGQPS